MDGSAWQVLQALPAWQISQIPRRAHARSDSAGSQEQADRGVNQRLQALVSAFHYGAPVAFGWIREHPGGPVQVLAAGPALAGGADGAQAVLTFPPGARAESLPGGQAALLLARMPCWTRLAGISDALLSGHDEAGRRDRDMRPSLEDGLMSAWSGSFAWLVLAEPVTSGQLGELVEDVSLVQLGAQRSDSPPAQLAAQRLSARHAELRQAAATGLWKVRLMAGGANPRAAAQVAGLLCASADLDGLPYALAPLPGWAALDEIPDSANTAVHAVTRPDPRLAPASPLPRVRTRSDLEITAPAWPFYASSRLVAAVARPPAREVPGVRFVLRPDFDVTPEAAVVSGNGQPGEDPAVSLGTVLDWNRVPAGELALPRASLNRHVFVCGATGAGKSQTVRALLEAATAAGIPWLVVEPAKAEYRLMAARLPGYPGDPDPAGGTE